MKIKEKDIQGVYDQLKNLTQYRTKTHEELWNIAITKAQEANISIVSKFKDKDEKKLVKELFRQYIEDYTIESISDKNTLAELIYFEVVQLRLQTKMNEIHANDGAVPISLLEIMHKNSKTILDLKNSLGLNKAKSEKKGYDALTHLQIRHRKWMDENQGSREFKCPCCRKFVLLKIRTEAWEAQSHPFFKDTRLFNKALFDHLGKEVLINNEFISKILETSTDYVDWMLEKSKKGSGSGEGTDGGVEEHDTSESLPKEGHNNSESSEDIQGIEKPKESESRSEGTEQRDSEPEQIPSVERDTK